MMMMMISSGTLDSVMEYGLPLLYLFKRKGKKGIVCHTHLLSSLGHEPMGR